MGIPIHSSRTISGNQPAIRRVGENASETFLKGVPVQLGTDGLVTEFDGSVAGGLAGFSLEPGSNLTTDAVAETLTFGSVQNQSAAANIPRGAPLNDGRNGFEVANADTVFKGVLDAGTTTQALVGTLADLVKDGDNQWSIDVTSPAENVVRIVAIDDDATNVVYFTVIEAARQIEA
ncbi:hypothetical protein LCGC14_1441160 [marine sediment metagenome]|uniref:Uncharacterized protein n=1 Tax=marine sediment metagenome TaxID=412755 RepID=A0A0F9MMK3_9ZZZZ